MYITKEMMVEEKQYLKELIDRFDNERLGLPAGNLSKKRIKGKDYIYYQTYRGAQRRSKAENDSKSGIKRKIISKYLSKRDLPLMESIKRRRFIERSLPSLRKNLECIEKLEARYSPYDPVTIIENMSPIYEGIPLRAFLPLDQQGSLEWLELEEEPVDFYVENLRHTTSSGRVVRSKSEAIIADLLDANKLKYKYEAVLKIGEKRYYPDFSILREEDHKIIYWEHFGLMNDEDYVAAMFRKIEEYHKAGIVLWDNLIMTSDSKEGGIDAKRMTNMIRGLLL